MESGKNRVSDVLVQSFACNIFQVFSWRDNVILPRWGGDELLNAFKRFAEGEEFEIASENAGVDERRFEWIVAVDGNRTA
jgi:hypothetical protein